MTTLSSAQFGVVWMNELREQREHMANKYEKRGEIVEFEPGDYCTVMVPKKDRPSGPPTSWTYLRASD